MPRDVPRLYVPIPMHQGMILTLEDAQAHYLLHVMRMNVGSTLHIFHDDAGEWLARVVSCNRKTLHIEIIERVLPPQLSPDLWLLSAPIKGKRMEYIIEKATELGVRKIVLVRTERTIAAHLSEDRLNAHAIEAAQQCERRDVPKIVPIQPLAHILEHWDVQRPLLYGDETGAGMRADRAMAGLTYPLALLIGCEGGFATHELEMLRAHPATIPLHLGEHILRADTATIAALTLVQHYSASMI
ncbi:MAG: 16S rRNA (uracil(1498)-N(3))-methyltransferase [Alphaproteobacteria bacterium]|nr:MAG: 16S rRNA (uracil(1498)-N(3))-methyltransferase [Alphaproteobacteria bacterium]TAF39169.1 MAG: 16S rRNA (uracil(1498)-N(3))-methyltransferase [Alphaproteobacteria bacterium]TAF74962.1 MAG: 16S rRNA (uracil(1498)-N(3))-methyltransferase [Alphaproteobacteria bacterium]